MNNVEIDNTSLVRPMTEGEQELVEFDPGATPEERYFRMCAQFLIDVSRFMPCSRPPLDPEEQECSDRADRFEHLIEEHANFIQRMGGYFSREFGVDAVDVRNQAHQRLEALKDVNVQPDKQAA